ncbi:NADP-dependent oxidoreductase [Achromobacter sp. ES-001]|uniref:NADP-dependent oxidoreductase n=1 Tax=Achromobacter sp. ES-001 TaxID=2860286 RepID=UPI001C6432D6|nr:NADP-dependent oxidoreductase [Achromobacter sp. ES-001]QYJ20405.1 NADP-dependent oxidoreductase [Achromobacter sp. ES-001]
MKAFFIKRYKDVGRLGQLPEPTVGENDVLVEVHAASVNVLDSKIRKGEFKLILPYRLPLILGNDIAGVVTAVGRKVRQFKIGDEVYGRLPDDRIGGFAELIAVDENALAPKPRNLDMEQAACVPLVALTAWQVLVETARLKAGQKVLIHAGSGGVGTIAIQLAKALGAHVSATTGSGNVEWVKALGADIVIDYRTQEFQAELHDLDVVLNSLGPDVLKKSIAVLKPGGKLISISGPPTPSFAKQRGLSWGLVQAMRFLSLGIRRKAANAGVSYDFVFMRAHGRQLRQITALIEAGSITPVVDRVFPLEATQEALTYVESGRAKGKVAIRVQASPSSLIPTPPTPALRPAP